MSSECTCSGPAVGHVAESDMVIAAGFGFADVLHDGELVFDGEALAEHAEREEDLLTVAHVEKYISSNPRRRFGVWEIHIETPLWDATWRRQAPGRWVCVAYGPGFA